MPVSNSDTIAARTRSFCGSVSNLAFVSFGTWSGWCTALYDKYTKNGFSPPVFMNPMARSVNSRARYLCPSTFSRPWNRTGDSKESVP